MEKEAAAEKKAYLARRGSWRAWLLPAALCALAGAAAAADWPMFRGNPARTGYSDEQASPPLTELWRFDAGGGIVSSPAVVGGVVYFGARDNYFYAVDANTGAMLWRTLAGDRVDSSPAVHDGAVYFSCADGYLYALNRFTGGFIWKAALGSASVSAPLAAEGKIFVGTGVPGKKLKAFDALTGAQLGEFQVGQAVDAAPAYYQGGVFFGSVDGKLYALESGTLAQRWDYPTVGAFGAGAVAVSSGTVYALPGKDENKLSAFNAQTGVQDSVTGALEATDAWSEMTAPAVSRDMIYFAAGFLTAPSVYSNSLYAFNRSSFSYVWPSSPTVGTAASAFGTLSAPAAAGGNLYFGTADGSLLAYSTSGALAQDINYSTPVYASPAVSNGVVYAATMGGSLYAYKTEKAAAVQGPLEGDIVTGLVSVTALLRNPDMTGYAVEYGSGETPFAWTLVSSETLTAEIYGDTVAYWDTSGLQNGIYTVRLSVLEAPSPPSENTSSVRVRVNHAPAPPSGLAAADVPGDNGNRIALAWTASPSAAVTAYRLYRDGGAGYALLAQTSAGTLSYNDTTAVTGTTYTYTARAFDGYSESADAAPASAFSVNNTGDVTGPDAVSDLRAVPGPDPGMVSLYWTATGNDGSLGSAGMYKLRYTTQAAYNDASAWTDFDNGAALVKSTRTVDGPAGTPEEESFTGLFGGVTYYFALKAYDPVDNPSGLSNMTSAYALPDTAAPPPASELLVQDTPGDGGGSLDLAWTLSTADAPGSSAVYGYKIYKRVQGGAYASSAPYASVGAGTAVYTDTAAVENVRFYYSVAAYNSTFGSPLSNEGSGVSANNWRFFDAAQGSSVRLADGARVDVPGGAASQNDNIMMNRLDPVSYRPLFSVKANTGANPTNIVYEVKFRGATTKLLKPALVTLPYADADVAGMTLENLRMYTLDGGAWKLLNTSAVDAAAKKVTSEVSHFSVFTIMEFVPSGALFAADEVYTYPNPATGGAVTFKFRVSEKSYVSIDVYDVAGQKLARLEKANCPAGLASEITWNMGKIASGVYQYRLQAVSASGSKSVVKRMAVIH
ncbi:MAG: PQQ-binding-like beta-propeller repeat protein [Elusimicrobia bacterium]|nr:PQQ-binding-like beta-propeller repeat protein [Elusimicrobiota bacterium]